MYVNFVNGTTDFGCWQYDELLPAVRTMAPLVTIVTSDMHSPDFGDLLKEPYGDLVGIQASGLALTLINIPSWMELEMILAENQQVVASITPCKFIRSVVFLDCFSCFLAFFLFVFSSLLLADSSSCWYLDFVHADSFFQGLCWIEHGDFGK